MLSVKDLKVTFFGYNNSPIRAVRGVSFELNKGEVFGIAGESGCGKSALAQAILRLHPTRNSKIEGIINFYGKNILHFSEKEMQKIRGNKICHIFQDPLSSFNPYLKVIEQLIEPLVTHKNINKREAIKLIVSLLKETGIPDAEKRVTSYPHQFSGGMLQRAMIIMAMSVNPEIIIADEPTTALDVTVQMQILKLMQRIKEQNNTSIIFISHNLGVIATLCDRVAIMYAGYIVETAPTREIFTNTLHPYTLALINSIPDIEYTGNFLQPIEGAPPDPAMEVKGCPFYLRCKYRKIECENILNNLIEVEKNHYTSCLRAIAGEIEWKKKKF
ncbi:MAG: ABC transporter ATP-binding protein [Chitinispirillaceae bacterium]|nr:ABC transporter ATP-binding protein [Chitinispirillaceae bacterium]